MGELLRRTRGGVAVTMTGADRFKLGFAAPHVTGRLGYLRALPDNMSTLLVRSSPVHPGLDYAEEPDDRPGHRGDALHIYDDDGGLGGFAEMEAPGTPADLGFDGSRRPTTDRFTTWWFRGPTANIAEIVRQLVHMEPSLLDEGDRR
ncbi:hypothetical protein QWJ90_04495 [Microbacterium oryzae]|uniref:hypothetical protein n=1 Tax=Microbacterium oryzae TaxID=743009 RepID=UPI0025B04CB8|nr:hypothetical protein [Microbacterium oryzae]MDN3310180.1 hypothetical protein [Microbacterium oryzae]